MADVDCRKLLLRLLHSLTLCDHMGDVSNDVLIVFKRLGMEIPESVHEADDWGIGMREWLEGLGVTGLYG